ncbi:type VI secretion system tube protein Hcp [Candidatus Woesearchaeota archaeon]|nr:type VI secretion system tube protein Hcp [Candidatus Woesearchaeota archaeon]
MKKIILVLISVLIFAAAAQGAAYIKFDGVDGESRDGEHDKWIEILSWEQSIFKPTTASARSSGVADISVSMVKELDKTSPGLMLKCAKGEHFPEATLDLTMPTSIPGEEMTYFRIEMKKVLITSYDTSGAADDRPTEHISLNFGEVEWEYFPLTRPE